MFDFERYRRPEVYGRITDQTGAIILPPELTSPETTAPSPASCTLERVLRRQILGGRQPEDDSTWTDTRVAALGQGGP